MSAIDWPLAVRVAGRVAGRYELEDSYHQSLLARDAPSYVRRAAELVSAETGLSGVGDPVVEVVGRRDWAARNVEVFSRLLAPAEKMMAEKMTAPKLSAKVMGTELGVVLGFLARRVLGQYELVLPGGNDGDAIYLVGGNVMWMERRFAFRPSEFRLWIALHECTHRLQFVGVPWMSDYFYSLVSQLVSSAVPEPGRMGRIMEEFRRASATGEPLVGEAGLFGLFANDTQRDLIDKVQALMSLLEGHGHVVMDRVGADILTTQDRMTAVLRQRRKDPKTAAFLRLTGLEMKMRQYEQGERFVLEVERQAGWSTLDRAWQGSAYLPTRSEIEDPQLWLERVA